VTFVFVLLLVENKTEEVEQLDGIIGEGIDIGETLGLVYLLGIPNAVARVVQTSETKK